MLRATGLRVEAFQSASSLLEVKDLYDVSCLVMDIRMPGLSAEELALELGQRGIHLPIIIITADDNEETRQIARRVGAAGYFRKPVDGAALLDAIKWACNTGKLKS
jgi:FixJ family two-component response regulator